MTGYTPLHIAMQFGRDNIFELLQNVYKADRDILDWSGKKALDYRRQKTAVSASTYSSKYYPVSPTASVFSFFDDTEPNYRSTIPMRKNKKTPKNATENSPSSVQRSASVLVQRLEHQQTPEVDGDTESLFSVEGGSEIGGSQTVGRRRGKANKSFLRKKFGTTGRKRY
uniref:Uncharacterized protein n=1 Tax=Lutzomyia longipalpis TaxID=7200 RepID=A0A1B0CQX0_LUTLO